MATIVPHAQRLSGSFNKLAPRRAKRGQAMADAIRELLEKAFSEVRTVGIWVFGLVASAIIGFAIGAHFQRPDSPSGGALWGMIAALGIFTCARLWLAGRS